MDKKAPQVARLTVFLNVYGAITVALFGFLFIMTAIDSPLMLEGGALRFMRWEIAKHVDLMIEIVYFVWGIFFFIAARKPLEHLSLIDFTIWANLAHGLLMIPQAYHTHVLPTKIATDVLYALGLSGGLWLLRPAGAERQSVATK
jgi:hypothetical protein